MCRKVTVNDLMMAAGSMPVHLWTREPSEVIQ